MHTRGALHGRCMDVSVLEVDGSWEFRVVAEWEHRAQVRSCVLGRTPAHLLLLVVRHRLEDAEREGQRAFGVGQHVRHAVRHPCRIRILVRLTCGTRHVRWQARTCEVCLFLGTLQNDGRVCLSRLTSTDRPICAAAECLWVCKANDMGLAGWRHSPYAAVKNAAVACCALARCLSVSSR